MATPAPAIMDLIHVGAARRRPSRCGRAISAALVLLTLSGCGGPTVVATAPAVLATASLPTATPTASASAPPPTPSAAPTPRTSPGALPPLEPPDGVILKMRDANYAISGDTAAELVAEMVAEQLVDPAGDAGFALTTWDVDWTYKYVSGPGGELRNRRACRQGGHQDDATDLETPADGHCASGRQLDGVHRGAGRS